MALFSRIFSISSASGGFAPSPHRGSPDSFFRPRSKFLATPLTVTEEFTRELLLVLAIYIFWIHLFIIIIFLPSVGVPEGELLLFIFSAQGTRFPRAVNVKNLFTYLCII